MSNLWGFSDFFLQNPILLLTLSAHILADFQWQSQKMADLKSRKFPYLILHLIIVFLPLLILSVFFPKNSLYFAAVWLSHVVIDFLKYRLNTFIETKRFTKQAFIVDQTLHLVCIFLFYALLASKTSPLWLKNSAAVPQTLLFLAIVGKPVNILFKLFFSRYQSKGDNQDTIAGAGAMIGVLERYIMALSLIFGQFASVGLVFTAKSIARYNKISESQSFAEYYLIGSLFSMISVLIVFGLLYL
ncbi:Uncharacterised protein [Streptococcus constellatus]|uniref:DUF3307 domain-containing protein n=1 Tax=Streptococcus constellatus TaxID=76860 RepID=A0A564T6R2_STRCV|nr:DUF3307 domain-containing protein [Streptococcus constellatus]VUX03115.1 Uncharacterised protein [Streptococcus constellatus]VUX13922.1 Uncharacterised protein [Streptococcus gordonii]